MKLCVLLFVFLLSLKSEECKLAVVEYTSASTSVKPNLENPDSLIESHTAFGCVYFTQKSAVVIHSFKDGPNIVTVVPKTALTSVKPLEEVQRGVSPQTLPYTPDPEAPNPLRASHPSPERH